MFDAIKKNEQYKLKNTTIYEKAFFNDKRLHDKLDKALKDIELGKTRPVRDIMKEIELEYNL